MVKIIVTIILLAMPLLVTNQDTTSINCNDIQSIENYAKKIIKQEQDYLAALSDDKDQAMNETRDRMRQSIIDINKAGESCKLYENINSVLRKLLYDDDDTYNDNNEEIVMELDDFLALIDRLWNNFKTYSRKETNVNENTLLDYADTTTARESDKLHGTLKEKAQPTILPTLSKPLKNVDSNKVCNLGLSLQGFILQIYKTLIVERIRGFIMMVYSYTIKTIYEDETYDEEVERLDDELVEAIKDYMPAAKTAITDTSRFIERCDAPARTRG